MKIYEIQNLVNTPTFKKWFNNSKVVDNNGNPLILYKGMHPYDWREETDDSPGPEITSINRTAEFPAFNDGEAGVEIAGFFGNKDIARHFTSSSKNSATYPVYLSLQNPFVIDAKGELAGIIQFGETGKDFRDAIRSKKYDGVIIKNTKDEGDIYVALRPEQIKSVFNTGTFDTSNPNISD